MIRRFTVIGKSMEPTYREGDVVLTVLPRRLRINDVVVCRDPRDERRMILKRITRQKNDSSYDVRGDNERASTDSRVFGSLVKKNILGKVVF